MVQHAVAHLLMGPIRVHHITHVLKEFHCGVALIMDCLLFSIQDTLCYLQNSIQFGITVSDGLYFPT